MKILLTNDDGYAAAGLEALIELLQSEHEVFVVAPAGECSNCGHCVTVRERLTCQQVSDQHWKVNGWPADCVRVALAHLNLSFDWVISGINHGGNLGMDIAMSGTCAAAREAAFHSIAAIAVSQVRKLGVELDWGFSASMAAAGLEQIFALPHRTAGFWNLNLPAISPKSAIEPSVICEPELQPLPLGYEATANGLRYVSDYQARPRNRGSDVDQCFHGKITTSFIKLL